MADSLFIAEALKGITEGLNRGLQIRQQRQQQERQFELDQRKLDLEEQKVAGGEERRFAQERRADISQQSTLVSRGQQLTEEGQVVQADDREAREQALKEAQQITKNTLDFGKLRNESLKKGFDLQPVFRTDPATGVKTLVDLKPVDAPDVVSKAERKKQSKLSATQKEQINSFDLLPTIYDSLEESVNKHPDLFGPISGRIEEANLATVQIGGDVSISAGIKSQIELATQMTTKAFQKGVLTDRDIERFERNIPALTDKPEVVKQKLSTLRGLMGRARGKLKQIEAGEEAQQVPSEIQKGEALLQKLPADDPRRDDIDAKLKKLRGPR